MSVGVGAIVTTTITTTTTTIPAILLSISPYMEYLQHALVNINQVSLAEL
jgi:hypothetical protein